DGVLSPPYHPYTEALLYSFPGLGRRDDVEPLRLSGEIPSPVDVPSGCPFHPRCPRYLGAICRDQSPPWRSVDDGHAICCHIPAEDLDRLQRPIFGDGSDGGSR
ncbi:MAG: oligopeptide/dipeptide ABC transporter ATP-binding protein, partial [Candidatus Bipolaricaulia bacterium]